MERKPCSFLCAKMKGGFMSTTCMKELEKIGIIDVIEAGVMKNFEYELEDLDLLIEFPGIKRLSPYLWQCNN